MSPLRNRVTPFGEIVAAPARGSWTGNRGCLHGAGRTVLRTWQVRRWITCRLEFRGRHRDVMPPGRWTALFFLDEATAMAAGHRPCGECRHADYVRFRDGFATVRGEAAAGADEMDRRLHAERLEGRAKRVHRTELAGLPDGAFVRLGEGAWLVRGAALLEWSPAGYVSSRPRPPSATVDLLTPPTVVAVIRAGYAPQVDGSADSLAD